MKYPNKTRILLIMPFFYPHKGGSQKYAEELHVKLMEIDPNLEVDVLAYNSKKTKEVEHHRGLNIYRIPCFEIIKDKFLIPNPVKLIKKLCELKQNEYDYVETHVRFFDATWWAWCYAKKIKAKSIYFGHVPGHPVHDKKIVELVGKIIDFTIAKFSLNQYDMVFYANNACKRFYEHTLNINKIGQILHIAINPHDFYDEKHQPLRSIPKINNEIEQEKVLVSYVGRMIETKGINKFYEAIKTLQKDLDKPYWDKLEFVFGGPGELEDKIRNRVQTEGLQDKVHVLGDLNYNEVKKVLGISNIFINPSSHDEGLPNTILEAGASGCFVIATDTGAISDVIKNKSTGLLIKKGETKDIVESITWVLNNKELSEDITNRLKDDIKTKYTWQITAQNFLKNLI